MNRVFSLLVVGLLLTASGCIGPEQPDVRTETATHTVESEPSATPVTPKPPRQDIATIEPVVKQNGTSVTLNTTSLFREHIRAVSEYQSVAVSRQYTIGESGSSVQFTHETLLDFVNDTAHQRSSLPFIKLREKYTTLNGTYVRNTVQFGNETYTKQVYEPAPYSDASTPINGTVELGYKQLVFGVVSAVKVENESYDNDSVTVYQVTNLSDVSEDIRNPENGSVERFNMTMYVGPSGVIRHVEWTAVVVQDGSRTRLSYRQTVSRLGNASVQPPEWVSASTHEGS